jgi:hypothetical protein
MLEKRFALYFYLSLSAAAFCISHPLSAQAQNNNPLAPADQEVKRHIQEVIKLFPQAEQRGRRIAVQATDDARGNTKHPWINGRDIATSGQDYYEDSFFMTRHEPRNVQNWAQLYGCHESGLLAYSRDRGIGNVSPDKDIPALAMRCRMQCLNEAGALGAACSPGNAVIAVQYALWLIGITAPLEETTDNNGYELVDYWFPEYQASINNYGLSRLNPQPYPPSGPTFTRNQLLSQKDQANQQILQGLKQEYPLPNATDEAARKLKKYQGEGYWGGYAWPDFEEKSFAHIYRVWQAWQFSNDKIYSMPKPNGWKEPANNTLYTFTDGFPPKTEEHEITNIWTEWGIWDMITSIPQFSYQIPEGQQFMNSLFGSQQPVSQAARKVPPFWQSKGQMPFRVGTWDIYKPLEKAIGVRGNQDASLKQVVYHGGYELYPLVTNMSGFTSPGLGTQTIFARRAFELAGLPSMAQYYPPSAGPIKKIMQYTMVEEDPSREIDKMQLIYPRKQFGASFPARMQEGNFETISECFRSQKIPTMTEQTSSDFARRNFPADLQGYVMDRQKLGPEGGDVSVAYWNHRVDCSCDICGLPMATVNFNQNGDLPKEPDRRPFCRYNFGKTYSAFVGSGEDTKNECNPANIPIFKQVFKGLDDRV